MIKKITLILFILGTGMLKAPTVDSAVHIQPKIYVRKAVDTKTLKTGYIYLNARQVKIFDKYGEIADDALN